MGRNTAKLVLTKRALVPVHKSGYKTPMACLKTKQSDCACSCEDMDLDRSAHLEVFWDYSCHVHRGSLSEFVVLAFQFCFSQYSSV